MHNKKEQMKFWVVKVGIIFCFFITFLSGDSILSPSQKLRILSEQLDSLNLVKQNLKRKGSDITEIEVQQGKLRDSLEIVKQEINNQLSNKININSTKLEKVKNIFPFLKDFSDFFDLLIVGMAVLAGISGIFLIRELSRNIKLRKLKKREKIDSKNTSIPKPPPAYPNFPNIPPSVKEYTTREYTNGNEEEKREDKFNFKDKLEDFHPSEEKETLEEQKKQEKLKSLLQEESSIEEKILKAAKMGFDINTISKNLHLSVDQVSLIIKVAESRHRKR